MILLPIISILLIQSSFAFLEDSYSEPYDSNTYPDDLFEPENDITVQRRSNHYLRFGRNNGRYNNDVDSQDYEDFARPTRSDNKNEMQKNANFIRFGRGGQQDFLRFGRDPQKRDRSAYLRFGRSIPEEEKSKKRNKRDTFSEDMEKRGSSFLRFGRNSNFVRFGRDPMYSLGTGNAISPVELLKLQEQTLANLLAQLMVHKKEEKPCAATA